MRAGNVTGVQTCPLSIYVDASRIELDRPPDPLDDDGQVISSGGYGIAQDLFRIGPGREAHRLSILEIEVLDRLGTVEDAALVPDRGPLARVLLIDPE